MTSARDQAPASRTGVRALLRAALAATTSLTLAATILVGPMSAPAAAAPPITVAAAQAQVDQLETAAEALDQQALAVKIKLSARTRALALKQQNVRQLSAKVARTRRLVGQMALAQYQNRTLDTAAQLLLSQDPDGFLNQIATVEAVNENQNRVLHDFQAEQAHLATLERSAKADVTAMQAADRELSGLRAASAAKIVQSKAVLARLTQEERARIAAQQKAAELAAKRAAEAAAAQAAREQAAQAARQQAARDQAAQHARRSASSNTASSNTASSTSPLRDFGSATTRTVRSTGKGAIALAFAKKQLGKPYVWGAEGPNSYDCSGLTSAAWRAAGITIPRVAQAQSIGAGAAVAEADLQPGDLVFFYTPVSHVALYVGNGMVIHAPRPGRTVTYQRLAAMPYAGARRPG